MTTTQWCLTDKENGLTALDVLRERIPAAPVSYLRQLLRRGKVRREGLPLTETTVVRGGERITLPGSRRFEELFANPPAGEVDILFESRELLVVFKEAGLATHRGKGHEEDNLLDQVQEMMKKRRATFMVAPVHRLDAGTSGPVLFGKGRRAAGLLGKLFMEDQVEKIYLGLVAGELSGGGLLCSPVPAKGKEKEAQTGFTVLASGSGCSLLELRLHSGRTHQIRRQLAGAGHPLAGDRRYRGSPLPGLDRPFLHCRRLALQDPFSGQPLAVDSPLPEDLAAVLRTLGMEYPFGDHGGVHSDLNP
jgi:RluA family pseudouridine synthase